MPGQFYMVWFPPINEIPLSVSYNGKLKGVTVKGIGKSTKKIVEGAVGDVISLDGPYGNYFKPYGNKILAIAGGVGIASIILAIESFHSMGLDITTIIGAKKYDELIFMERANISSDTFIVTTDDGSYGEKGFTVNIAEKLIAEKKFDSIITCGPEIMMKKIVDISLKSNIKVYASIERIMKCAIGICDSCVFGAYHICMDGPIFTGEQLKDIPDFGKWKHGFSGEKIKL